MPENPRQGQPVWVDYECHEFETTKNFYTEVFGWDIIDQGPDFGHYHQIMKDDHPVGGFMRVMNMDGTQNLSAPARWNTYLNTADIHTTYQAALASGASEISAPMPVGPLGISATVTDATGADVGLWQTGAFTGFDTPFTPGMPVWFELMTSDFQLALNFYRSVFGFDISEMEGFNYATHGQGDEAMAGICDASQWTSDSYWRTYFNSENADATTAKAVELGGTVLDGPMDTEFGRIVSIADPEGATFQVQQDL